MLSIKQQGFFYPPGTDSALNDYKDISWNVDTDCLSLCALYC